MAPPTTKLKKKKRHNIQCRLQILKAMFCLFECVILAHLLLTRKATSFKWGQNRRLYDRSRLWCKLFYHLGHKIQHIQWHLKHQWQRRMLGTFDRQAQRSLPKVWARRERMGSVQLQFFKFVHHTKKLFLVLFDFLLFPCFHLIDL